MKEKPTDSGGSCRAGSGERYMAYFKSGKHGDSPKQAITGKIKFPFSFFHISFWTSFSSAISWTAQSPFFNIWAFLSKRSRSSLWPKPFSPLSYLSSPQSPSESASDREWGRLEVSCIGKFLKSPKICDFHSQALSHPLSCFNLNL